MISAAFAGEEGDPNLGVGLEVRCEVEGQQGEDCVLYLAVLPDQRPVQFYSVTPTFL